MVVFSGTLFAAYSRREHHASSGSGLYYAGPEAKQYAASVFGAFDTGVFTQFTARCAACPNCTSASSKNDER